MDSAHQTPAARRLAALQQQRSPKRATFPYLRAFCGRAFLFLLVVLVVVGLLLLAIELLQHYLEVLDVTEQTRELYIEQCTNLSERSNNELRARDCQQRAAYLTSIKRFGAYNQAVVRFLEHHNLCGGITCVTYFRDSLSYLFMLAVIFMVCLSVLLYWLFWLADSLIHWDLSRNRSRDGLLGASAALPAAPAVALLEGGRFKEE